MIADVIKRTVAKRFKKQKKAVFFELGLCKGGRYRADVFALSMRGHVTVVEVKSSVYDFRSDKKMHHYLNYCDQFYLAVTKSVYDQIDFDLPGAGVFILSNDGLFIDKVKPAKNRGLDEDTSYNLAIRAAFRNCDTSTRKNKKF